MKAKCEFLGQDRISRMATEIDGSSQQSRSAWNQGQKHSSSNTETETDETRRREIATRAGRIRQPVAAAVAVVSAAGASQATGKFRSEQTRS